MASEVTLQRVKTIVIEQSGDDGDWIAPWTRLGQCGDSLTGVEIIMACEDTFEIEITDAEWSDNMTIERLADMCEEKTSVEAQ